TSNVIGAIPREGLPQITSQASTGPFREFPGADYMSDVPPEHCPERRHRQPRGGSDDQSTKTADSDTAIRDQSPCDRDRTFRRHGPRRPLLDTLQSRPLELVLDDEPRLDGAALGIPPDVFAAIDDEPPAIVRALRDIAVAPT